MNHYPNSAGFLELLSSQQSCQFQQQNSFQLGDSEAPFFSSQAETQAETSKLKIKRIPWTVQEDLVLISGWLNTSKDVIVGNEQRGDAFWKRIADYFAASPHAAEMNERGLGQCKHRWSKVNEICCKFAGSHQAATNQMTSGMSDDDQIKLAHQIYASDYKKKFTMEHAWRALRNDQKWCALKCTKETEKNKQKNGEPEASNVEGESESRPEGVKAAKRRGKRQKDFADRGEQSLERINSLWEVRQKDFALKQQEIALNDKLANKKLLECILGKREPLSEIEEELKVKLIREILM